MSMRVDIPTNLADGFKKLGLIDREKILNKAVRKGAVSIAEALARKVPVSSGFTRETTAARRNKKSELDNVVYYVSNKSFYFRFINDGTKYIQGRHDLEEAYDENIDAAVGVMTDELKNQFRKTFKDAFKGGR